MIYFDNAATTVPICLPKDYFNPSSPHALGIKAERALRDARKVLMDIICADTHISASNTGLPSDQGDIIFTSGGTESNNLAILGFSLAHAKQGCAIAFNSFEHPSIHAPALFAEERGWAATASLDAIPAGRVLVSISHVNHETGDINDLPGVISMIKKANPLATIHVDGAQGFCKEILPLDNVDLYSFSGHKFHGPPGVGGLWVRKGVKLVPLLYGGGQEREMRSGTENTHGIIQMAEAAVTQYKNRTENREIVAKIKETLLLLCDDLPQVTINIVGDSASPFILNMSFLGVKGEILVHALSEKGVYVSMGAACRSRKNSQPGLQVMGFSPEIAESAIRFSFSSLNTMEEALIAREIIISEVNRFRKMKG